MIHTNNPTTALITYMKQRAAYEKVTWTMPDHIIQNLFNDGLRTFFGVTLDNNGNLLKDEHQPEFFTTHNQ